MAEWRMRLLKQACQPRRLRTPVGIRDAETKRSAIALQRCQGVGRGGGLLDGDDVERRQRRLWTYEESR